MTNSGNGLAQEQLASLTALLGDHSLSHLVGSLTVAPPSTSASGGNSGFTPGTEEEDMEKIESEERNASTLLGASTGLMAVTFFLLV